MRINLVIAKLTEKNFEDFEKYIYINKTNSVFTKIDLKLANQIPKDVRLLRVMSEFFKTIIIAPVTINKVIERLS